MVYEILTFHRDEKLYNCNTHTIWKLYLGWQRKLAVSSLRCGLPPHLEVFNLLQRILIRCLEKPSVHFSCAWSSHPDDSLLEEQ